MDPRCYNYRREQNPCWRRATGGSDYCERCETKMTQPTVSLTRLVTATGAHIRMASKVTYPDGQVILFTERLSKREALRQAEYQRSK